MESNQISKSYQTPQTSQNRSLVKFCINQEEADFVYALEKPKISELTKDNINSLIDTLAKWRWMSGISNNESENEIAKELALLSQFIIKNYGYLTINEITLAIDLSLLNKLDCDVKPYNNFSPMYVSRILNAYIDYRKQLHKEITDRKHKLELKSISEKKPTPKERMDSMIELIEYFYYDFKGGNGVNDHFNTLYNYFRRTNRLNPDKEMINKAMEYGEQKSKTYINDVYHNALQSEKPNKDNIVKRFARNYCVERYFSDNTLEHIISQVEIKDFSDV